MAVVGWTGAGMEACETMDNGRMSGDAGAFPESEVNTLITPDRTTIQASSSR